MFIVIFLWVVGAVNVVRVITILFWPNRVRETPISFPYQGILEINSLQRQFVVAFSPI
jgi:hypothetical protein